MSGTALNMVSNQCKAAVLSCDVIPGTSSCSTKSPASVWFANPMSCWLNTRSPNSRASSLFCSGVRISIPPRSGHRSKLHHHLRQVHLRPRLVDLALLHPQDLDVLGVDGLVIGCEAEPRQPALVRAGHPLPDDDEVAFREDVLDLHLAIRERAHRHLMGRLDALPTRRDLVAARRVRDEVVGDELVQHVEVLCVVGLLETPDDV